MHIENLHIHVGSALGAAALAAFARFDEDRKGSTAATSAHKPNPAPIPRIGEAWPGIDGIYAGVSRGENGEPDAHLVLLNAVPDHDLNWEDAIRWASDLGDGARLPTRFESALLYANLQDKLDASRWHWTRTQYSSYSAWGQGFSSGYQGYGDKSYEFRARAVRRLVL